jgi:hypothetical protein
VFDELYVGFNQRSAHSFKDFKHDYRSAVELGGARGCFQNALSALVTQLSGQPATAHCHVSHNGSQEFESLILPHARVMAGTQLMSTQLDDPDAVSNAPAPTLDIDDGDRRLSTLSNRTFDEPVETGIGGMGAEVGGGPVFGAAVSPAPFGWGLACIAPSCVELNGIL